MTKRDVLTEIANAIDIEKERCYWEVVEIHLTPSTHKGLLGQFETERKEGEIACIDTLFGIPVVVDDTIPKDRMWVIRRKRREEVM